MKYKQYVAFEKRMVIVGFGSIGQGVLPLILRHIKIKPEQITILTADARGKAEAKELNITFVQKALDEKNYKTTLQKYLSKGDFLVNLSVDVSSVALIEWCNKAGVLYIDTVAEPWAGVYTDPNIPIAKRTNYNLREQVIALKPKMKGGATAISCHGANPGLVSHFVKQALLNIAKDTGHKTATPKTQAEWGSLAQKLGIKTIHIAEQDTQRGNKPKQAGEFVNTWSVDGFISEGNQPAEMGWGSHEKHFPADGKQHTSGCGAAIYLMRNGASTRVRTWTPLGGAFHGFIITHNESISIADYYTVKNAGKVAYRPTVHYAYHPCDDAVVSVHELAGKNWVQQKKQRILMDEIVSGIDELGVLLMGHKKGAYWYGSVLSIAETRKIAPYNNATSLQVTVAVLAGVIWAIENPNCGVVESDELDFARIMEISKQYLGKMVGKYSDWTPLQDRAKLFPEDLDTKDPWQFKNFRVM